MERKAQAARKTPRWESGMQDRAGKTSRAEAILVLQLSAFPLY